MACAIVRFTRRQYKPLVSMIDNTFATPVNFRPLERGFDLDPRSRTGIEDRDRAGHQGGKEIDQSNGDQQLCSNCAVIPKLLQHAVKVSTAPSAPPDHALHARSYASLIPLFLEHPSSFVSHFPIFCWKLWQESRGKTQCMSEVAKKQW